MKKAFTLFNIVALLGLCSIFTACETDEDVEESMVLTGQWQGNWGMYYDYEYRGKIFTFDSYDTDIVFYPDYDYAPSSRFSGKKNSSFRYDENW